MPGPAAPRSWLGPRVPVPSWSHSNCMMVPAGSAVPDVGWKSVTTAVGCEGCGDTDTGGGVVWSECILGAFAKPDNNVPSELHPKHAAKLKNFFFPFNLKVTAGKSPLASAAISPRLTFGRNP